MKKILMTGAMTILSLGCMMAQTVTGRLDLGYGDRAALSIPKEFTYNHTPLITLHDDTENRNLLIYDENLELIETVNLKNNNTFDYQLTYQNMTREVLSVNEINKQSFCSYESYDEFLQREKMVNPGFDESQLIINKQENGDSIITVDYSLASWSSNEQMYFAYNDFGMKYPKVYLVCSHGAVTGYRTYYTIVYSDWKNAGTCVENKQVPLNRINLCNVNLNQGGGKTDYYFEVSQTLFNEDEDFEYLIPKYKLSSKGNVSGEPDVGIIGPSEDETVTTTQRVIISEEHELALAGFQIVSTDGTVIDDLTFEGDFEGYINDSHAFVITIGNHIYLAFDGYANDQNATIFYKIDKATTEVRQVKMAPASMSLFPSVMSRNNPINISFGDDNKSGSDIVVVSATGTVMKRQSVPAGQTSIQMLVPYTAGVYGVSRVQNKKVMETKKIIVK